MKTKKWPLCSALSEVKGKRPCVCPNEGFMDQLRLYEAMRYRLDKSFLAFKLYKLSHIHQQVTKAKILPAQVKNSLQMENRSGDSSFNTTPNSETSSSGNESGCLSNNTNSPNVVVNKGQYRLMSLVTLYSAFRRYLLSRHNGSEFPKNSNFLTY